MLKSLLNFGNNKSILVCETDGFFLRGAVLTRAGNEIVVLQTAESQQADMAEAVADVIKNLKANGWEGHTAVLLSPTVFSSLLELPVNPKKPRPLAQMYELVRWEAEPLLMQHTTQWSVGNLLIGRGYMTKEQADAVMDLQQGRPNPAGGIELKEKFSLRRFGDLAEELGYIKRSQLNACLAGQEWLKSDDELIECGWAAQGEVSDVPGTYNWQVSAVSKSLLQRWTTVFQLQGVTLQAMYPLAGSSASLLNGEHESQTLVESHSGLSFVMQLEKDKVAAQYLYLDPSKSPLDLCLEAYHTLTIPSDTPVVLSDWNKGNSDLQESLSTALSTEVNDVVSATITEQSSPGMVGAALHYLGMTEHNWVSHVRLGGPLPDLWQRVEVRAGALAVALLAIILLAESFLMIHGGMVRSEKAEVDSQWQLIDSAMKRIKGDIKQVEERKKELAVQKESQQREQQRLTFFGEQLPARSSLVQVVLGLLQETVSDEIIINSIDENGKRVSFMPRTLNNLQNKHIEVESFNVEAWSLTETAAQQFIQKLEKTAQTWNLNIVDSSVIGRLGPLDLDGFAVTLRIVKLVDAETLSAKAKK